MKRIRLDYGTEGLEVELPDGARVIEPSYPPGVADPMGALRRAILHPIGSPPLADLARKGSRVAIAVCDGTRPQPRELMLEALFEAMPQVRPEDVVILVATVRRGPLPERRGSRPSHREPLPVSRRRERRERAPDRKRSSSPGSPFAT